MKFVTIVGGELFEKMAEYTIPLMEEALGGQVTVIEGKTDPWRQKLTPLADEPYLFVDCDVVFRRHFDVSDIEQQALDGFVVAPQTEYEKRLKLPSTFITTGMFAIDPSQHINLLERAVEIYDEKDGRNLSLKDERPLNQALLELNVPVIQLPLITHRVYHGAVPPLSEPLSDDDYSRHFCGGATGDSFRLIQIKQECKKSRKKLGLI